jgi:transposase
MRDVDLFSRLLRLEPPWRVEQVSLDAHEREINVWLAHRRNTSFTCPGCGRRSPLYDHAPSRAWRHLDHGDCLTWLHARPPRVACPDHGIRQVHVPLALPAVRFTIAFGRVAGAKSSCPGPPNAAEVTDYPSTVHSGGIRSGTRTLPSNPANQAALDHRPSRARATHPRRTGVR